jgi:uncharacterized membrane protein YdjX (TVP38/TMEM64 family)
MYRKQKIKIFWDIFFILLSIAIAVFLEESGAVGAFLSFLGEYKILAVFVAGIFFTSVFTTASSIVLIGELSKSSPVAVVAIIGGAGALIGDYVIFRFVKDRIVEDFKHLLSYEKRQRFARIFHRKLFRYFVPFLGGLLIASPLPDELGVTVLGASKMKERYFFLISFVFNSLGILAITLIAKGILGT